MMAWLPNIDVMSFWKVLVYCFYLSAVKKEPVVDPSCIPLSQQLMSPFGGFLPCMDNTLFPYMYPGLPGMIPNMGLPIMQPGLIPGNDSESLDRKEVAVAKK